MNLDREIRNGYEISSQMKKVWNVQLLMVQKLLSVCEKYGLKIYADGGTLLGLVRDHGYIPWDDDIDMLMLREDYDRLVAIADKEFLHPFFLQTARTEKRYFRGHAQLRYDGTSAILPMDIFQPFHQGIFIDIFVYDEIPDVEDEQWLSSLKRADSLEYKFWNAFYAPISFFHPVDAFRILKDRMFFKVNGIKHLFDTYEQMFRRNNGQGYHRIACPCFNRRIFKTATKEKNWYDEIVWLPFEGIMLPAPKGYDNVLRTQFGADYSIPRKAPSLHGGFAILDTDRSYLESLKILQKVKRRENRSKRIKKLKSLIRINVNHDG